MYNTSIFSFQLERQHLQATVAQSDIIHSMLFYVKFYIQNSTNKFTERVRNNYIIFTLLLLYINTIFIFKTWFSLFEKISLHCQIYTSLIPVSFVLGFYVAVVIGRWWNQYLSIPYPDSLALYVSTLIIRQVCIYLIRWRYTY